MRVKDLEVGHCGNYSRNHIKYIASLSTVLVFANTHRLSEAHGHIYNSNAQTNTSKPKSRTYLYISTFESNNNNLTLKLLLLLLLLLLETMPTKERRKCDTTCSIIPIICRTNLQQQQHIWIALCTPYKNAHWKEKKKKYKALVRLLAAAIERYQLTCTHKIDIATKHYELYNWNWSISLKFQMWLAWNI